MHRSVDSKSAPKNAVWRAVDADGTAHWFPLRDQVFNSVIASTQVSLSRLCMDRLASPGQDGGHPSR